MTAKEWLERATREIARRDAELLLTHVLGRDRVWLLAHPEAELSQEQAESFQELVRRREAKEPIQYLTGQQEFFGLEIAVTPDVLIPRPETELLVEAVLAWMRGETRDEVAERSGEQSPRLVDVGTGSGAIALALARALPEAEVRAVDVSEQALGVARGNAERLGLAGRVAFFGSDLLAAFRTEVERGLRFDAVVSNPPYVPAVDAPGMQAEVRDFEPHLALFAGEDGLQIYRRLIPQAWEALRQGGLLALEFGFGQREALAQLLVDWNNVRFLDDYAAIPRIALAERPSR